MNKILLSISILLNSILIACVVGILPFLLYLSILSNVVFISYAVYLLRQMNVVRGDLDSISLRAQNFAIRLKEVSELEMFYGDETLEALMRDAEDVAENLYDYAEKYLSEEELDVEKEEE